MKKLFLMALGLLLSFSLLTSVSFAATKSKTIKKYGHTTTTVKVYSSQKTSSKALGTLKKNQNVYIYVSQNGLYQVKYGARKGWVSSKNIKLGKYVAPKTTVGKKYSDGWVAPVLKSAWSPNQAKNFAILQKELEFTNGGTVYGIQGKSHSIEVAGQSPSSPDELEITWYFWTDPGLKQAYRIPIVSKEVFKLYFGKDATRVWNYFNSNDIPDNFTANGRKVHAVFSRADGSVSLQIGKKK